MKDEGKYLQLWKKYIPLIRLLLKKADKEDQTFQLYKHEFDATGVSAKIAHTFNLEMQNGKVMNNVRGMAVVSDLIQLLRENKDVHEWIQDKHLMISMGKGFDLTIKQLQLAEEEV